MLVGVGAGDVEDEIGTTAVERLDHRGSQGREIDVVVRAVVERHVERTRVLSEREVSGAVDRHREHGRIGGEDLRRAVALMDIAVEDQHPPRGAAGLHLPRGNGGVVEHTEALAPRRAGVVRAAR